MSSDLDVFNEKMFKDEVFLEVCNIAIAPIFFERDPDLANHEVNISEMMVRYIVSLLQFPGEHCNNKATMEKFLRATIIPIFCPSA